jgi:hypothetical protein
VGDVEDTMKAPVAHDGYGRVAKRLLGWAMGCAVAALLLCLVASGLIFVGQGDQNSDRVQIDLTDLHRVLKQYRDRAGAWPAEARWSEVLVEARLLERSPLDPWDRPYQYRLEVVDGGETQPVVSCMGRDGVAGTEDDLLPRRTSFGQ